MSLLRNRQVRRAVAVGFEPTTLGGGVVSMVYAPATTDG